MMCPHLPAQTRKNTRNFVRKIKANVARKTLRRNVRRPAMIANLL